MYTVPADIDTFVRETGQNFLDASLGGGADISYRFITLRGAERRAFEEALRWDTHLLPHVESAAAMTGKFAARLREGLEQLQSSEDLVLMRLEDRNTQGLTGAERRQEGAIGNFVRFCRGNLMSEKAAGSGGSYGLGKAVNWRCSLISTVLVNSRLSEPLPDGRFDNRIYGRSDLSFHIIDDAGGKQQYFSGRGQFGEQVGETTNSVWDKATFAEDLYLGRTTTLPGTSIGVLGFHNPASPSDGTEQMAKAIRRSWETWFWPALLDRNIGVTVEIAEGRNTISAVPIRAEDGRPCFVDALEKYRRGEIVDELREPGDVVVRDITLTVPRRRDGTHAQLDHKAKLVVRLAAEGDDYSNEVALFRRQGMVIEYLPMPDQQTGGTPFHAFVMCGQAAGSAMEDLAAEEFLRAAEPPAHDKWDRTDDLFVIYVQGGLQRIKDFKDGIRRELRNLFAHTPIPNDDGPDALKRLLQIGGPPPVQDKPYVKSLSGGVVENRWRINAEIRMSNREEGWSFEPFVAFVGESGTEGVRWSELKVDSPAEVIDRRVIVRQCGRSKTTTVRIEGTTDIGAQLIPADRAAVTLLFRNVGRVEVER
ncbi:hypothetical protein AU186_15825 [Mycobacterium sp. GA-1999]|nr:hypothetical protein AU185_16135 [Mycobacterium sp. GA-0227b]KUH83536.1 hypothetical protein AU186_15825 [Mycobacterium sp. GA-1999]